MKTDTKNNDAMDMYGKVQYLVQNEIHRSIKSDQRDRQFTAFQLPQHGHTGFDTIKVQFSDLAGVVNHSVVTTIGLSSAQIKALHTTPILLVPNQGTNAVIIVDSITAYINYGGTAYTGANNLEFRYTGSSGVKVTTDIANTFINSTSSVWIHAPAVTAAFTPVTGNPDGGIYVCVPTANPATGNSTINITVKYYVVSSLF